MMTIDSTELENISNTKGISDQDVSLFTILENQFILIIGCQDLPAA